MVFYILWLHNIVFIDFLFLVCPNGFDWLDNQGCVFPITTAASKTDALKQCRQLNPNSQLLMSKTAERQRRIEEYAMNKNLLTGEFFLGMAKVGNYWMWDDFTPVFVRCKRSSSFLFVQ
jgi:hypothetical protein